MVELLERYRGSIIGLAIGDAIGHPTEFISSVSRIKAKYGEQGVTGFNAQGSHKAGTFTDDTQMTISVARALIRKGHAALDDMMALLGEEFVAWAEHPSNNRAPGGTCLAGCRKLKQGAAWRDAGVKESKGCGAAMRAAPVGLMYFDDDDLMVKIAAAQSALTHSHPTGIASSVAAAAPIAWIAKGNGLDGIVAYTKDMVGKITIEMLRDLKVRDKDIEDIGTAEMMSILDDTEIALSEETDDVCGLLGGAWVGEEAVACALWCVLKAAKGEGATSPGAHFREAVLRGANSSGDSDSIACIAGSIVGALHGYGAIPAEWSRDVERANDLDALARKLHDVRTSKVDIASVPGSLDFFDTERPRAPKTQTNVLLTTSEEGEETHNDGASLEDPDEEPHGAPGSTGGTGVPPVTGRMPVPPSDALNVDVEAIALDELEQLVVHHNEQYWVHAAPEINDVDFDRLTRALQRRKPSSEALKQLGARPDAGKSVTHREPMLSLDKCYEQVELEKWASEVQGDVVVLPKVDGLACSLRYDASGALEIASTRGDGEVGEDITPNARAVRGVPSKISQGPLEVRGEVFMSLATFEKHKADKSNPRNLAAGALRQKDPNNTRKMDLQFLAYDVKSNDIPTQRAKLALLETLGFPKIDAAIVSASKAFATVTEFAARRAALAFETDGVVVMADSVLEQKRLGVTSHHPRWAIAWKFQGEEGTSILRGVEWSVARTGTITPVAQVDPVQLSGVTVTRATLHHRGQVAKLGLTIGATLAMVRRGGVIPHVERVITAGTSPVVIPTNCPACGAGVVEEGDFLMCASPSTCVAARIGRVLHFLEAMDVQGMGEVIVEECVTKNIIQTPADLFRVKKTQLANLDKCGEKNAEKIMAEIEKAKTLPLDVVLRALGIANLGKTAARTLAERFETLAKVRALTPGEIGSIKGFGDVIAQSIVAGLKENSVLLDELAQLVTIGSGSASATTGGSLAGKSFVFTGALTFDRKQAEARVKKLGAAVPSGVTKALTHLVVGGSSRDAPSTKQKAADKLVKEGAAIQILDEAAFLALMRPLESPTTLPEPAPAAQPKAGDTEPPSDLPWDDAPVAAPVAAVAAVAPVAVAAAVAPVVVVAPVVDVAAVTSVTAAAAVVAAVAPVETPSIAAKEEAASAAPPAKKQLTLF